MLTDVLINLVLFKTNVGDIFKNKNYYVIEGVAIVRAWRALAP